jgi:serine/threonine-protein kinase
VPDLSERLRIALADRYAIEREIGRGGMATVFLAKDLRHGRSVAMKVLHPELASIGFERFQREIGVVAGLTHPNILPLHDSGEADGLLYYVMPYVDGESLADRLHREQQLPLDDALRIARQVAGALSYAHERGVIHRDIKPDNILLADGEVLVADFGIARVTDWADEEALTATGVAVGTPAYMSPEQGSADESLDARTDIYSLGCVLYEMLIGEPPFGGPSVQVVLRRHAVERVPGLRTVRDTIPDSVEQAVTKAMAKLPVDRFASAAKLVEALSIAEAAYRTGSRPSVQKQARAQQRALRAAVAVAVIAVAAVVALLLRSSTPTTAALDPDPWVICGRVCSSCSTCTCRAMVGSAPYTPAPSLRFGEPREGQSRSISRRKPRWVSRRSWVPVSSSWATSSAAETCWNSAHRFVQFRAEKKSRESMMSRVRATVYSP